MMDDNSGAPMGDEEQPKTDMPAEGGDMGGADAPAGDDMPAEGGDAAGGADAPAEEKKEGEGGGW